MVMKFGIAVLGATGYVGSPYRREIRECTGEAEIVSLCGRRLELLEPAAVEKGAHLFTDDWRGAITQPGVNLVVVCTPDSLHHEAVMFCAEKGLHVVCEKPVGINVAEASQMWDSYRDKQLGHFVPFWTRYVTAFRLAREICESGELGEIRGFIYRWHNPRPDAMPLTWRDDETISSAGSIADIGSHAYDTLRWILGEEAKRVLTHADVISPAKADLGEINLAEAIAHGDSNSTQESAPSRVGETCDYASIAIEMENGAVGTIVLSHAPFFRRGVVPELELHGTEASLTIDRITGAIRIYSSELKGETVATLPDEGLGNRFKKCAFPAIRNRIDGVPCEHPGLGDGFRVQLFTEAALVSSQQGCWVDLKEIEDGIL